MVRRQLHNKRSRIAGKQLSLFQNDASSNYSEEANEVHNRSHVPVTTHNSAGKQSNNRQLSTAGDKGGSHDSQTTVGFVFNSTGSHNTRYAATCRNKQRDEAFAAHAELTEETVHNEGYTCHITAVLQKLNSRNTIAICGAKPIGAPMPPIIPSTTRDTSQSSHSAASMCSCTQG